MAELIASDIAASLLAKLGSTAYKEICLAWGLKGNMEKLKGDIRLIKGLLIDAVENQVKKEGVIEWLTQLKNVFLDAEDVLDEFDCEKQRRKFVEVYGSPGRKVRRFISRSNPLFFSLYLGHTIEDITKTLDKLYADCQKLGLIKIVEKEKTSPKESSFVYSKIIGRDDEQRKIVDRLVGKGCTDHDHKNVSVIHIYGMAGIGKTALAKLVFNDERVDRYFLLKIWIPVSKELDVQRLLEMMLDYVTRKKNEKPTKDHLIAELQGHLKHKRFLLILDNVWDVDEDKWEELSGYLIGGCKGSKIIITTRNQQLKIRDMKPDFSHKVDGLSPEYSLSLFLKHTGVEAVRDINRRQRLIKIGKEIVDNKCEGVPLVLKTLGNLLYTDSNEQSWSRIKESKIWELPEFTDKVVATLLLSYNDLSFDLKRCFLCCSLFPRRKEICSLELIQLWIAHGVLPLDENKCLEDIGHKVFKKLRLKSFFKNVTNHGWYYTFHMDDAIHELALIVAKNEYLMVKTPDHGSDVPETVRHLAIRRDEVPSPELDGRDGVKIPLSKKKSVRTIIFPCLSTKPLVQSFFNKHLIKNYVNLRMLDLSESSFETLPSYIGGMKRLRSLNLSWNRKLTKLPESICKLQSLQSLQLQGCTELEGLPRNIKNLRESLIFLSITTKEEVFDGDDSGIQYLTSLRTLIIDECHKLQLISYKVTESLAALKTLVISNCEELWFYEEPEIVPAIRLQRLILSNLPKVAVLPSWLEGCKESLQYLYLSSCSSLSRQLEWLLQIKSLMEVQIIDCPQFLSSSPDDGHGSSVVVRSFQTSSEGQKPTNYYQHEEIHEQQIKICEKSSEESSSDSGLTEKMWSEDESLKLIQTMLDLYGSGKLKAEEINVNPAYHLEAIKKSLVVKLPGLSDIATEHIESQAKFLKAQFEIVHEILNGSCRNEFEWNSNKKMATAEEKAWDVYIQIHPEAKEFRNKPFPFYKELEELDSIIIPDKIEARKELRSANSFSFKASTSSSSPPSVLGGEMERPATVKGPEITRDDGTEEGEREPNKILMGSTSFSKPPSSSPSSVLGGEMKRPATVKGPEIIRDDGTEEGERKPNKILMGSTSFSKPPPLMALVPSTTSSSGISLAKNNENIFGFGEMIGESMKEAARIIAGEIKDVFGGIDAKFVKLNDELTNITSLTMTERHKATRIISQNNAFLSILFSLPDEEKEEWVRTLLKDST